MMIHIAEQQAPVLAECDVLVCGGGPAGIAAAVSAARRGCKVVLLERWASVGGQATNALVNVWHTSDHVRQVIFGLMQECIERGGRWVRPWPDFPKHFETHLFEPEPMKMVFQDLLDGAGVRTLCHLVAGDPVMEGRGYGACWWIRKQAARPCSAGLWWTPPATAMWRPRRACLSISAGRTTGRCKA